jgi:hypothetical protein
MSKDAEILMMLDQAINHVGPDIVRQISEQHPAKGPKKLTSSQFLETLKMAIFAAIFKMTEMNPESLPDRIAVGFMRLLELYASKEADKYAA